MSSLIQQLADKGQLELADTSRFDAEADKVLQDVGKSQTNRAMSVPRAQKYYQDLQSKVADFKTNRLPQIEEKLKLQGLQDPAYLYTQAMKKSDREAAIEKWNKAVVDNTPKADKENINKLTEIQDKLAQSRRLGDTNTQRLVKDLDTAIFEPHRQSLIAKYTAKLEKGATDQFKKSHQVAIDKAQKKITKLTEQLSARAQPANISVERIQIGRLRKQLKTQQDLLKTQVKTEKKLATLEKQKTDLQEYIKNLKTEKGKATATKRLEALDPLISDTKKKLVDKTKISNTIDDIKEKLGQRNKKINNQQVRNRIINKINEYQKELDVNAQILNNDKEIKAAIAEAKKTGIESQNLKSLSDFKQDIVNKQFFRLTDRADLANTEKTFKPYTAVGKTLELTDEGQSVLNQRMEQLFNGSEESNRALELLDKPTGTLTDDELKELSTSMNLDTNAVKALQGQRELSSFGQMTEDMSRLTGFAATNMPVEHFDDVVNYIQNLNSRAIKVLGEAAGVDLNTVEN